MKKCMITVLAAIMVCSVCGCRTTDESTTKQNSTAEQIVSSEDEITLTELSFAAFWLENPNSSDIVMTPDEIQAQNELLLDTWGTDWTFGYYDVKAFPEKIDGEWLKERICYLDLRNTKLYYKGEAISNEQWDAYFSNCNLDAIPEETAASYAVINENTSALDLPTEDIFTNSNMNEDFNALQETTLKINEPVIVLQESLDTEWVFAIANEYIGWVRKEACSFFPSRQEWLEYQDRERFLMVTEDCSIFGSDDLLLMGTKLYLTDAGADSTSSSYTILLPKSGTDGLIQYEELEISRSEAIHEGYLPFTRDAVLTLAFQELGDPYGWGGTDGKRDCSSYVKDIYACFGFQLPRNSRLQQTMPGLAVDLSALSESEKEACLENASAGDILGISGHIMLYLGEANGKHYVISMLSSYIPEDVTDDFEHSIVSVNQVTVNSLNVKRKNGNTWLQELTGIVSFSE